MLVRDEPLLIVHGQLIVLHLFRDVDVELDLVQCLVIINLWVSLLERVCLRSILNEIKVLLILFRSESAELNFAAIIKGRHVRNEGWLRLPRDIEILSLQLVAGDVKLRIKSYLDI